MQHNIDISLHEAAKTHIESAGSEYNRMYGHHLRSFKAGANWQKEQDKAIHDKLVKALSLSYDYMKELNGIAPGTINETILNSIDKILNEVK